MGSLNLKKQARIKRKKRIRKRIFGTNEKPRLSVFRSSKHIYAQVVNDVDGLTLASASSLEKSTINEPDLKKKIDVAKFIGKQIAKRSNKKGIKRVVFDRNGFLYHGRVKALSEGAREEGLEF